MPIPDRYPRQIEKRHQRRLRTYVAAFVPVVQEVMVDRLPDIYPQPVMDSKGSAVMDDLTVLSDALGELRLRWGSDIATDENIEATCSDTLTELDGFNGRSAVRSLRSVGVKVIAGSQVEKLLPGWVEEHTALIVRGGVWRGRPTVPLGEKTIQQIGDVVQDGFIRGLRHEEVADEIAERLGVMRSRANLIARDQTNKMNGQMTRNRYTDAGIYRYTWQTARDERVRETHAELDGTEWDFRQPPAIGNCGEPIQCRCVAEPIRPPRGQ